MYPFQISLDDDSRNMKLMLEGISIITDGYRIEDGQHYFNNPNTAIAYFFIKDEIYSLSNRYELYGTAEEFFDVMKYQHAFFDRNKTEKRSDNRTSYPGNAGAATA